MKSFEAEAAKFASDFGVNLQKLKELKEDYDKVKLWQDDIETKTKNKEEVGSIHKGKILFLSFSHHACSFIVFINFVIITGLVFFQKNKIEIQAIVDDSMKPTFSNKEDWVMHVHVYAVVGI